MNEKDFYGTKAGSIYTVWWQKVFRVLKRLQMGTDVRSVLPERRIEKTTFVNILKFVSSLFSIYLAHKTFLEICFPLFYYTRSLSSPVITGTTTAGKPLKGETEFSLDIVLFYALSRDFRIPLEQDFCLFVMECKTWYFTVQLAYKISNKNGSNTSSSYSVNR